MSTTKFCRLVRTHSRIRLANLSRGSARMPQEPVRVSRARSYPKSRRSRRTNLRCVKASPTTFVRYRDDNQETLLLYIPNHKREFIVRVHELGSHASDNGLADCDPEVETEHRMHRPLAGFPLSTYGIELTRAAPSISQRSTGSP